MKKLIILILIILVFKANATTYYVSNTGNDSNSGLTTSLPWKTMFKVSSTKLIAGDEVLLKCGDVWHELLSISSSGNSGAYISISSYGTGNKPKILGSTLLTSWTNVSGNIWISTTTTGDPYALPNSIDGNIYFIESNGNVSWGRVKKANTTACIAEYDWTWASNHIYIYSPTDPNTRYSGIEVAQRLNCIDLNNKEYVNIVGIELAYSASCGIADLYPTTNLNGLNISNCKIHHIGIKGSSSAYGTMTWHSNSTISNNTINDCGRRGVTIFLVGASSGVTVQNITVENNTFYNGFHTTGVDINNSSAGCTLDNIIVRYNYIYDDPNASLDGIESYTSGGVYAANQGGTEVKRIYIYNNIFVNNLLFAMKISNVNSCYVYNNTVYGVNQNMTSALGGSAIQFELNTNATVKNNIVYNNIPASNTYYRCLVVGSDAGTVISDNNLFYNKSNLVRLVTWYNTSYYPTQWSNYLSASNQDTHSISPTDPLFVSTSEYNLQSGSPAINSGVDVGLTTDYLNNTLEGLPDIGAYEYITPYVPPVVRIKGISAGNGKAWGKNGIPYGVQ